MTSSSSSSQSPSKAHASTARWRDYYTLCKPRVVALIMLTALIGMCLASPGALPLNALLAGNLGIALSAASAAALNHWIDRRYDIMMKRTHNRPLATGRLSETDCLIFAGILGSCGLMLLYFFVNPLTTYLTFSTLIGYAFIYSVFLKHATPQNIVIGGITGAAPPLLGWTAVTGHIAPEALLLVLIIFTWTPPHFWALAIDRFDDYAQAKIPMLPNTHGIRYTKINILLYTILLCGATLLPFAIGMSGYVYLPLAIILNARFLYWAIRLQSPRAPKHCAIKTFKFSIAYLMYLFLALLVDHYYYVLTSHPSL